MSRITQICAVFIVVLWCGPALSSPIFESINIERKVNIDIKPMKFRPITFIKEKLGPFGKFIKKHTIERRDVDEILNTIDGKVEDKPIFAERIIPVIEKEEPIGPVPEYLPTIRTMVVESQPPVNKLNTDISGSIPLKPEPISPIPIPVSPVPITPFFIPVKNAEVNKLEDLGAVPIVGSPPIEGPLLVPVTPKVVTQPPSPLPPPPPPGKGEVPRGSRFGAFARFFGEIISEIVNRVIARARVSFGIAEQPAAA